MAFFSSDAAPTPTPKPDDASIGPAALSLSFSFPLCRSPFSLPISLSLSFPSSSAGRVFVASTDGDQQPQSLRLVVKKSKALLLP
jgi:hypothetical protein